MTSPSPHHRAGALAAAAFTSAASLAPLPAAEPGWWTARQVLGGPPAENYAPANLGQAKWMAHNAYDEFVAHFGAGVSFNLPAFTAPAAANYAALNTGQLKALSARFYEDLHLLVPQVLPALFEDNGVPSNPHIYPWDPNTPTGENYAAANLGQLKLVFRFDFDLDGDADGLADWWEYFHFGHLGEDRDGDFDGDGSSNGAEYDTHKNDPDNSHPDPAGGTPSDIDADGKLDAGEAAVPAPGMVIGRRDNVNVGLSAAAKAD